MLNPSIVPQCTGDEPGTAKGVRSGTVGGQVKPVGASTTVRASKKRVVRKDDPCTLNDGNANGLYTCQPAPGSAAGAGGKPTPEEPAVTPDTPKDPSRRSWLGAAGKILGVVALAEFAGVAAAFLWPRRDGREGGAGDVLTCGPVDEFTPHSVTAFPAGRFYLVRLADGGFLALSRTCTHLGCTVPWDEAGE